MGKIKKKQMGGFLLPLKPFSSLKTTLYFWRNLKFDRFAAKNLEHPRTSVELKKTQSEDVRKVYDIWYMIYRFLCVIGSEGAHWPPLPITHNYR